MWRFAFMVLSHCLWVGKGGQTDVKEQVYNGMALDLRSAGLGPDQ